MRKILILFWLSMFFAVTVSSSASALTYITEDIITNTTWGPTGSPGFQDTEFLLEGFIFVQEGAELNIEPGVTVYGSKPSVGITSIGTLIIERGAKIHAVGTPTQPIIFTSEMVQLGQTPAAGDWGGIIIDGYAPIYYTEDYGELGDIYGGGDPYDNSGEIQYVRIEYAGHWYLNDEAFSGIAFQGVGNGTTVNHLQVHMSGGDCVKIRGGTVNMKYVIGTSCGVDSFDWGLTWTGFMQYLLVKDRGDAGMYGINTLEGNNSLPVIYNATLVGDPYTDYGTYSAFGMMMRDFTAGHIHNMIVTGFKGFGLRMDEETSWVVGDGNLVINNGIFWDNNGGGAQFDPIVQDLVNTTWTNLEVMDHQLCNPLDYIMPNFAPAPGSPALDGTVPVAVPPSGMSNREHIGDTVDGLPWSPFIGNENGICDGSEASNGGCINYGTFFEATSFIGAVDSVNDWTYDEWTTFGAGKQLVCDLDYSNSVNIFDVVKLKRIAVVLDPVKACADANNDGDVNIFDVVKAKRMAVSLDPVVVCCTE
jgi:hypothetical protein